MTTIKLDEERPCWWLGINNINSDSRRGTHVAYPQIETFLHGNVRTFNWRFGGSSGSHRYYSRMRVGDGVVFWMGHGSHAQWGIIGFGTVEQIMSDAQCVLARLPGTEPITPYPKNQPGKSPEAEFLRAVFGIHYRPLRDLFVRLGYTEIKRCVATIDEMTHFQFVSLLGRAQRGESTELRESESPHVLLPEEIAASSIFAEGASYRTFVNKYERNVDARRVCIAAYGTDCCICGFNFGAKFGNIGDGFIHVHHLKPLSEINAQYAVDPIADLRPVCPNCHAMLHRRVPAYSISEMQTLLDRQKTAEQSDAHGAADRAFTDGTSIAAAR